MEDRTNRESTTSFLREEFQVIRSSETFYDIKETLTMTVKTFVRINPVGEKDAQITVSFRAKADLNGKQEWVEINSGDTFNVLKEKYFKADSVVW